MATKLKNFLSKSERPSIKYIWLSLLIISLAGLFETLFNLIFSFRGGNLYNYVSIHKFYFFGRVNRVFGADLKDDYIIIAVVFGVCAVIFAGLYYVNKDKSTKLEDKLNAIMSKRHLEVIILPIIIAIIIRYFIWGNTLDFYDNILILMDIIILSLVYITINFIRSNKENLENKSIIYKLIKNAILKQNRKSLNKKVRLWFVLVIIINFITVWITFYVGSGYYYYPTALMACGIVSIPISLALIYIYRKLSKKFVYIDYISNNIKNIEDGDLKYQLKVEGNDEIANLALSINNITKGLDTALDNQIKSEKMKTELITNVSHDLKTPLTSIVNYVDILKNNELDNDTIKDYINILDRKSKRLKVLVEDIFEASKISSGDIELNIEKTDIKELLIQSIVELEDKIEGSKLDFVIDTPDECIYTMVDGKRIYRVFENLINNILKYSLENTRVYIDMFEDDEDVNIILKNISNHRLNMKPEELLERFRRGDVSRNTEGSGLGLSIAQNLISIQGGSMDLYIDGDLFKVMIKFKKLL